MHERREEGARGDHERAAADLAVLRKGERERAVLVPLEVEEFALHERQVGLLRGHVRGERGVEVHVGLGAGAPDGGALGGVATEASSKGATYVGVVKDSATGPVKSMYFMQRGAAGIVRSDMIDLDKIMYINYTPAADMARTPNTAAISFNSAALSGGAPIVGQDYVLRVEFQNPMGMSPDNKYFKFGVAHSVTGDTLKSVILKLAKSLAGNLKRDVTLLIKIYVATAATGTNKVEVTSTSNISDTTTYANNYTHIILEEVAQPWSLGVQQQKPVVFTVGDSPIKAGTPAVDIYWADVIYSDRKKRTGGAEPTMSVQDGTISSYVYIATAFNNSKLAAELEYFSMGERADRYRNVGWPDSIATEYLADSNAANGRPFCGRYPDVAG